MENRRRELDELPDGSLRGPDGVVYRRTPQRVDRKLGRELLADGAVVVTDVYPDGLTLFVNGSAEDAWSRIAPRLVTGRRPAVRDLQWVGHVWASDDGHVLLRFTGEH
ncbi:hypothetical protein [Promicromonospora sp. NPDC057488]|uniref:hypothetical protein n=1 Tax=Promicromonospora sp. NPDC057488 TaxID=3346147 RepID=UPI00366F3828